MEFIKNHFDFKVYPVTWTSIIIAVLLAPCVIFLPQSLGYENGVLENIQMVFLFLALITAFKAPINKKFFRFAGLVIIILILREVNCGRTLFFAVPGTVNQFYGWKEIKYGWLAHPLYGLYIASTGLYFIFNKLYINLWNLIREIKFPAWNILLMLTGMALGMYAEKSLENMIFEEMGEMLFYASLMGIIWLYAFNKNFRLEDNFTKTKFQCI